MESQAASLQLMEVNCGVGIHLQPGEVTRETISTCNTWRTPCQRRWVPKGGYDPVGSMFQRKLLDYPCPVAPWAKEPILEQVCWQEL